MYLAALDNPEWSGPFNATARDPVTNREFARELGRVLHRPTLLPIPSFALQALYGEMASVVTRGFEFRHPAIQGALRAALARRESW
jgi:uncharacterized protein